MRTWYARCSPGASVPDVKLASRAGILGSILVVAVALAPTLISADEDHGQALRLREAGTILPLAELLERLRPQISGQLLEIELEERGGSYVYEAEVLDDSGRVREFEFDARDGRLLGEHGATEHAPSAR